MTPCRAASHGKVDDLEIDDDAARLPSGGEHEHGQVRGDHSA